MSECLCWHTDNDRRSIESKNEWVNAWCNVWVLCVVMRGEYAWNLLAVRMKSWEVWLRYWRMDWSRILNEWENYSTPGTLIDSLLYIWHTGILLYVIHMHCSYLHQFIYNKYIFTQDRAKYSQIAHRSLIGYT